MPRRIADARSAFLPVMQPGAPSLISHVLRGLFFLLFFISQTAFPQQSVKGRILDPQDAPVAYANVGVVGRNAGTVSAPDGSFSLALDTRFDDGMVRISAMGYVTLELKVPEFRNRMASGDPIRLERNVTTLKEVAVRNFSHPDTWGNTIKPKERVTAGFANNKLGNELGMLFKAKKKPVKLMAFEALVAYNHYKELKFRLNVYAVRDGLPAESLLTENIIFTSEVKKGRLLVDLSDYGIVAEGDFFVSLEWIEDLGEGGLHFVADYSGPQVLTRAASQGVWNRQDDLSFAFRVSVRY